MLITFIFLYVLHFCNDSIKILSRLRFVLNYLSPPLRGEVITYKETAPYEQHGTVHNFFNQSSQTGKRLKLRVALFDRNEKFPEFVFP